MGSWWNESTRPTAAHNETGWTVAEREEDKVYLTAEGGHPVDDGTGSGAADAARGAFATSDGKLGPPTNGMGDGDMAEGAFATTDGERGGGGIDTAYMAKDEREASAAGAEGPVDPPP